MNALTPQRALTNIRFRRDGADLSALAAGRATLTLRLSSQAVDASRASEQFASNHGNDVTTVFQGDIVLPASPQLTNRNDPDWGPQHSFAIPFSVPFTYRGGTLCIDVQGSPVQPTRWPIDYHADLQVGRVQRVGAACGPVSLITTKTARVADQTLRPGASITFQVMGERNSLGVMMMATTALTPPVPLDFLGAPGCWLHVDPMLSLWAPVTPRPGRAPNHPGIGEIGVQMPHEPGFVGSNLFVQWLNVAAASLAASDALQLTFAGGLGSYDASSVTSARADGLPMPGSGRVVPGHAPVVRIAYQ